MCQKTPPEKTSFLQDSDITTRASPGNKDSWQQQLEFGGMNNKPSSNEPSLPLNNAEKLVIQQIGNLSEELRSQREDLARLLKGVEQLGTEKRVLSEMHDRCRELSEQFHEREFLKPVFLGLIGIADRCRRETAKLQHTLNNCIEDTNIEIAFAIRSIIKARKADLIEIENLLANYGVESFKHTENTFDPKIQKCIRSVKCDDPRLHRCVAQQILPGYRRNGCILRPEYISVYVAKMENQ